MNEEKHTSLKFLGISATLLLLGTFLIFFGYKQIPVKTETKAAALSPTPQQSEIKGDPVLVTRVVDGDTIVVEGGEKVRYIGIDTPETVDPRREVGCFGKEASEENKKLVEGKEVVLVKDVSDRDKFGRLLRYVYLKTGTETVFVNDYLARNGFARVSTYPPDVKFASLFLEAERSARELNKGLWKECL